MQKDINIQGSFGLIKAMRSEGWWKCSDCKQMFEKRIYFLNHIKKVCIYCGSTNIVPKRGEGIA